MGQLEEVASGVQVREHDALTELAMPQLQSSGGYFYLGENASLVDAGDFGSLVNVGAYFTLRNMPELRSLAGLPLLDAVGEDFQISGNPLLPTCDAIALEGQLSAVGGESSIFDNLADACGG